MKIIATVLVLIVISGFVVFQYDQVNLTGQISADVENLTTETYGAEGFAKAYEVIPISFPEDLGPHFDYKLEWWYYTGNLADVAGNRYGFQLTFFRQGITPGQPDRQSEWASNQIYFAHFTITDATGQTFNFYEKFSRGNPGLAGAQSSPYYVWIDDWYAKELESGQVQLKAQADGVALDLALNQTKPATLQGDQGLSAKSTEPGNASYYYSLTNNKAAGTITTPRGTFNVTGKVWKDHEWSTSALGPNAVGWDWFSLQLDDNREIMLGKIRNKDGSFDGQLYGGSITQADGSKRGLTGADVQIETLDYWQSPHTEATYPAQWKLTIPDEGIDVLITPLLNDQELRVSTKYWEGAVKAEGAQNGYGYIELTGYTESIGGRL